MGVARFPGRHAERGRDEELPDVELLALFDIDPQGAWDRFLDRYSGLILGTLRHLGFDHDAAMDRFVHVCEKLSEDGFRRLRQVRYTGRRGELVPWLCAVTRNLAVSWSWSVDGRRRLFKSIETLPECDQRIFELYFWQGRTPSDVWEHLRIEGRTVGFADVLDALERIFQHLDHHQRWRLASRLARHRATVSVESPDPETGRLFEPAAAAANPEERLLDKELEGRLERALEILTARQRLILQLRFEDALGLAEVAEVVKLSVSTVKNSLRTSLEALRATL